MSGSPAAPRPAPRSPARTRGLPGYCRPARAPAALPLRRSSLRASAARACPPGSGAAGRRPPLLGSERVAAIAAGADGGPAARARTDPAIGGNAVSPGERNLSRADGSEPRGDSSWAGGPGARVRRQHLARSGPGKPKRAAGAPPRRPPRATPPYPAGSRRGSASARLSAAPAAPRALRRRSAAAARLTGGSDRRGASTPLQAAAAAGAPTRLRAHTRGGSAGEESRRAPPQPRSRPPPASPARRCAARPPPARPPRDAPRTAAAARPPRRGPPPPGDRCLTSRTGRGGSLRRGGAGEAAGRAPAAVRPRAVTAERRGRARPPAGCRHAAAAPRPHRELRAPPPPGAPVSAYSPGSGAGRLPRGAEEGGVPGSAGRALPVPGTQCRQRAAGTAASNRCGNRWRERHRGFAAGRVPARSFPS